MIASLHCLQKKNPLVEIGEKLKQQENEMQLLRELIVKGFENIPLQLSKPCNKPVNVTEDNEINKNEVTSGENTEIVDDQAPELPLPVPELL